MITKKNKINLMMGYRYFPGETITVDATVYDEDGNLASGIIAWPKGRYSDRAGVLSDGNLFMDNVNVNDIIVFSYFGEIIHEVAATDIGSSIVVGKEISLDTVYVNNNKEEPEKEKEEPKKDNTFLYLGFGILGLLVVSQIINAE
ncbi:MAG: hypothetical protein ACX93I_10900 [Winogradskyella sp.]